MNRTAFIIGNGPSRKEIDLNKIKKHGATFGCNSLYLEFTPDVLVSYDEEITRKIEESGYPRSNVFYSIAANVKSGSVYMQNIGSNNSGVYASHLAIEFGFRKLYLIGFDLLDINNVAPNLYNMGSKQKLSFWEGFSVLFAKFKKVQFIRVTNYDNDIDEWLKYKNYSKMSISDFNKNLAN